MNQSINLRSITFLSVALIVLLGYNYLSAQVWTQAPANPPTNNTAAPINVGPTMQAKTGNLAANIFAATTEMRSNRYCDALGLNCFDGTTADSFTVNPFFSMRQAGFSVPAVPAGVTPDWPSAIICESSSGDGYPIVFYAHTFNTSVGVRYRSIVGDTYDFNLNGTYRDRTSSVELNCSDKATGANLRQICEAKLCVGANN